MHHFWHGTPVEAGRQLAAAVLLTKWLRGSSDTFFEHGLQVPGNISVAGFDDGDIAQALWPPLTTLKLPIEQMAHCALSLLLSPDVVPKSLASRVKT